MDRAAKLPAPQTLPSICRFLDNNSSAEQLAAAALTALNTGAIGA